MKIAKKTLSVFLSLLMIFSVCSVGLTGITASAAAGDSKYTHDEVVALVNAATANGFTLSSSGNAWNYTEDDGSALAAAEAIFDYAVKTYRAGKDSNSAGNSGAALYEAFDAEFNSKYANVTAARRLVKNVLDPDGTPVYAYEAPGQKSTTLGETTTNPGAIGTDVTGTYPLASYPGYYVAGATSGVVTKTSFVQLDVDKYLMTFDSIDDIPSSFITSVKYTYAHVNSSSATISNVTSRNETTGSGCDETTTTYYTPTVSTTYWNYMTAKPVRAVTKNTTAKKSLLSYEKYFNAELLATTREAMLAMSAADIEAMYRTSDQYFTAMNEDFSPAVLTHFGLDYNTIAAFMDDLYFAYRVVVGIHSIDTLNNYIGSEYNEESYSEMSSLYTKVKTAYDVVYSMDPEIINYIVNDAGYAEEYDSVTALKAAAESYIATLYDIMTEQRLEELVASIDATYDDYYSQLNKEDIETPTDAEVIGLVQKVDSYNSVLALYPGMSYYRTYWTTEHETKWADFGAKLNEVSEVRGLKADFETYYSYFMPIIFTTQIVDLDNDAAIDLHQNMGTHLDELRASYNSVADQWGYTIADKIFTINYEGKDYLLQTLIDSVKSTGMEALKQNLIDRTQAQLDAVAAYSGVTVVNFDNFAEIKSTLTHFDYELYDYVNGQGWLNATQTAVYSQVQTLLDRYHAFTTTDGKAFFDEDFTYADADGSYATRYAGDQTVEVVGEDDAGNPVTTIKQIGYPNDIARSGAEDNYVVTEEKLLDTVARIDNFIVSRDFGALVGFVDEEEEPIDLATYVDNMLNEMLYTDEMMNTLVGAIFPMVVELIEEQLVGAIADMDGGGMTAEGIPFVDLNELINLDGQLQLFLDMARAPSHGEGEQKDFPTVFAELGLYIYPSTLADSLAISNPAFYGVGTEVYNTLKAAGRDWSALVSEDDENTVEDETKALELVWGVYDEDSFLDTLACILDSILPLLQTALSTAPFEGGASNAAIAYSPDLLGMKIWIRGGLALTINPLNVYNNSLVPLFESLGIENIPTLAADCSSDEIVDAVFGTLLDFVDDVLKAPLSTILDILPNLVYFLSMDSVQEIIDGLNINLNLRISEVEVLKYSGGLSFIVGPIVDGIDGLLADQIAFDVGLNLADELNLYDLLGFEISNFNEVLTFLLDTLGAEISLPPIRQQEIIFCSDWSTNAAGRVDLQANKGDIMYWFLDYVITALGQEGFLDSIMALINGAGEEGAETLAEGEVAVSDEMLNSILNRVIYSVTSNPDGALAAIVELLNPVTYDLEDMDWVDGAWNYEGIEGANQMSIVYLNYGNDWTREDAEYMVENIDSIVASILEMTGSDIDNLGAYLKDTVNGLFTNDNITALVEMLGGFGDSASAVIEDVVKNQIGIDLNSWFIAFGYLFPAETWADDAEIIKPDSRNYVNNFGVEGIANEDGTISWFFNKMPLVDGDGYTFINILSRLLGEASLLIEFLFAGEDVSAFEDLLTIKGYETYDTSLGLILEMLGVENLPTQADFNADTMGSFTNMLTATLDWFYALTDSEDMIAQLLELIPDVFYFIESNGLSTLLHNLLMPVWVLVDTVRPLLDVDINGVLSLIVSDLLNYGTVDINVILQYVVDGIYVNDDLDYKYYSVDINNLTLTEIIKLVDQYIGTNLYDSGLVQIGVKGLCSGAETVENTAVGTIKRTTVTAADAITIIITAFIDCLSYPTANGESNGDVLFGFIADATENEDIAGMYTMIAEIIEGIVYEYDSPNWGYMFTDDSLFDLTLPEQSIVYLGYTTDWTKETADSVYSVLDEVLELVLDSTLEEGETIATLLNGLLEDNVYSDEILNTVVELIVNALADLDAALFEIVDVVVDTNISEWFTFCELVTNEETGEEEYVCTKDWGVDEAAEADKKDLFAAGIKEVLAPANELLAWLFFGDSYAFFTGSETDAEGNYTFNDLITLNGGEGYAYGLVPILEALGCEVAPASTYYDEATKTYNVGNAVEGILNSVLALVDEISANPVEEVFKLLPNLIYFINADGIKTSVNNLLAPVDAILEKLAPVISEDGEEVSLGAMLEESIGINISDITTETLLGFAADAGFVLSPEMIEIICNLYVGKLAEFTSANGRTAYKLDVTGYEGDVLTLVLSIALDAFNLNSELFSELLGEETYYAVYNLIRGASEEFVYRDMNWAFMYDGEDAASQLYNNGLPERTGDAFQIYTQYQNNWNTATADYLDSVLDQLVKDITDVARNDGSSLGMLLDDAITGGLYQDDILNSLIETVVELMIDYEEIVKGAGALLGAESISDWFDYCEITTDENGETVVTCVKDWGVDAATTNDAKRAAFVEGFVTALEPAYRLLAWLLFGEDYTFLNGTTNEVLITLTGGEGYENAFVPLLEGLMCTMNYEGTESGIKPASAYYDAEGNLDMEQAVRDVFTSLTDWLNMICGDLDGQGSIGIMLDILPNFIYFVNADGLKVVVNNLLVPVNNLLDALEPMGVEVDLNELIGMDITNFDFYAIFDLVADLLGLYFPDYTQDFLASFYIGEAVAYESANGKLAYRLAYTDEEPRRDMITCLISFVVDAFVDPRNDEVLIGWMGEDIYNSIVNVLNITEAKPMEEYDWLYTESADTDKVFTAIETSGRYSATYNKYWTKDKAEYLVNNLQPFVSNILCMLGLEIGGVSTDSLEDIIQVLLSENLYTQANADAIIEAIQGLVAELENLEGFAGHIEKIADTLLGIDIRAWDDMTVTVVDGDRESFSDALGTILAPAAPALELLLVGGDIKLFYSLNGGADAIVIPGSEGYAYGVVPLLEALGCDTVLTPDEYKAAIAEDPANAITGIIDPLFDRVDAIVADPLNEIVNMLPAVIYFINSNGLDTAVKNIVNTVDTVLIALEPVLGSASLMDLLGIDLATYDFQYLFDMLMEMVEEETGFVLTGIAADAVAELTTGKVVTYESANGETYYTMEYASENDKADMLTIILRLVVDFVTMEENLEAIKGLLVDVIPDEDNYNSVCSLLDSLATAAKEDPDMGQALYVLYYVFFALSESAEATDDLYHDVNNSWQFILKMLETSEEPVLRDFATNLKGTLNKYFDGIFDDEGIASDGAMTFFEKIAAFFEKIAAFFRRLFGME